MSEAPPPCAGCRSISISLRGSGGGGARLHLRQHLLLDLCELSRVLIAAIPQLVVAIPGSRTNAPRCRLPRLEGSALAAPLHLCTFPRNLPITLPLLLLALLRPIVGSLILGNRSVPHRLRGEARRPRMLAGPSRPPTSPLRGHPDIEGDPGRGVHQSIPPSC